MQALRTLLCLAVLTLTPAFAQAIHSQSASTQATINVLNNSAIDWNRGDLDAFATSYKNAPDILFMGRTIRHGYAQMLSGYKASYPTREKMGKLSFTHLETQPLSPDLATVTGNFHL